MSCCLPSQFFRFSRLPTCGNVSVSSHQLLDGNHKTHKGNQEEKLSFRESDLGHEEVSGCRLQVNKLGMAIFQFTISTLLVTSMYGLMSCAGPWKLVFMISWIYRFNLATTLSIYGCQIVFRTVMVSCRVSTDRYKLSHMSWCPYGTPVICCCAERSSSTRSLTTFVSLLTLSGLISWSLFCCLRSSRVGERWSETMAS